MRHTQAVEAGWTLFLDFDGVLNNDGYLRNQRNHVAVADHRLFDPKNVAALNRLCADLPVIRLIITSTWREGRSVKELQCMLDKEGFAHEGLVAGKTASSGIRGEEIKSFLARTEHQRWLILDDMNLHDHFPEFLFQTSAAAGFTDAMCEMVLEALR